MATEGVGANQHAVGVNLDDSDFLVFGLDQKAVGELLVSKIIAAFVFIKDNGVSFEGFATHPVAVVLMGIEQ